MSKGLEALKNLGQINLGDNPYCYCIFEDNLLKDCYKEEYKKIEKDLEILEILKKKMTIETDYYDSDIGCEDYEYIAYNGEPLNIVDKDEFNKIKEWLENDKRI